MERNQSQSIYIEPLPTGYRLRHILKSRFNSGFVFVNGSSLPKTDKQPSFEEISFNAYIILYATLDKIGRTSGASEILSVKGIQMTIES
jgi:hypothetical protein